MEVRQRRVADARPLHDRDASTGRSGIVRQDDRQRLGRVGQVRVVGQHVQDVLAAVLGDRVEIVIGRRWNVYFLDRDGDRLVVAQGGGSVVVHDKGDQIVTRTLLLRGPPTEETRLPGNGKDRPVRKIRRPEGQLIGRNVGVACRHRERQQITFVHCLVADGVQIRFFVHLVDRDLDHFLAIVVPVVRHLERHVIDAGTLCFRGRPIELAPDVRPVRLFRVSRLGRKILRREIEQTVWGVRIGRRDDKGQQRFLVHFLGTDGRIEKRRLVLRDGYGDRCYFGLCPPFVHRLVGERIRAREARFRPVLEGPVRIRLEEIRMIR